MFVERDLQKMVPMMSRHVAIVAVVGARQAGKTTLLKELTKDRNANFISMDDPEARGLFEENIKKFDSQFLKKTDITVLDEVYNAQDAGSKLKYLADEGRKLWITASSETLLSKEVLSHLVGRVSIIRLHPFSLREYLRAMDFESGTRQTIQRHVWTHMLYGGYPKVVLAEDTDAKKNLLRDLRETMIFKDVAFTFSLADIGSLERLVQYLSYNLGAIISYSHVTDALGISFQTLKKYLDALEKSHLITLVKPYCRNKGKEISKQPKVYFQDTGMANSTSGEFPVEPEGDLFENYILMEILKAGAKVKYWRTKGGAEVDFILDLPRRPTPVEVKLKASPPSVGRGLRSFIDAYKPKQALVVTYRESSGSVDVNGCKVEYLTVDKLADRLSMLEMT